MGMYDEIIKRREENNIRLEQNADQSLKEDRRVLIIENEVDDAQSALQYILGRFGIVTDRIYGSNSISSLMETILDPIGIMYEHVENTGEECKEKTKYILAFREDGKAVAIMPTWMGYRYYCPSDGSGGYADQRFCKKLKKGCYVFCRPLTIRKTILRTFIYNILHTLQPWDIWRLLLAALVVMVLGLIVPGISRYIYKTYIPVTQSGSGFITALIVCISAIGIRALVSMAKGVMLNAVKLRVSLRIQAAFMAKILHLPYGFFRETSSGKISRRVASCGRLSDIILDVVLDVLLNLTFSVAYLFQMHALSSELFTPALILIAVYIGFSIISSLLAMINETLLLDLDMEYTGFFFSAIKGVQKIKGLGAETFVYSRWADMYRKRLALTYKQPFVLKYSDEIMAGIRIFTTVVFLSVSVAEGLYNTDYLTFVSSYTLVMTVVGSLTDIMKNLFLTAVLCNNVEPIFEASGNGNETLEYVRNLRGDIKVENLHFTYDTEKRGCLDGISLDIRSGEKLAVVGESGCGKSTLLKILLGLEKADSGNVYYDEKSISGLNQKSLRRCIGTIFQFSRLFPGTIAENIAFGKEEYADEKKIWEAADAANIGDDIRSLPLKMNTEISESNSGGFSGGQRQRILLARAFLGNPKILFLDEATSALDNVSQKAVLQYILDIKATVIMVAHRLSTVENFDRIIMLENGRIAEEGTYSQLMEKNGRFARLVRKQLL